MTPPKMPKVGDAVHYHVSEEPRAAFVTEVGQDAAVGLVIFYPSSISFAAYASYSPDGELGTWRFPEENTNDKFVVA